MSDLEDLELLIGTRTPLIFIETAEPQRVEELFLRLAARSGRPLFRWALAVGLARVDIDMGVQKFNAKPGDVLGQILATSAPGLYLLLDLQRFLDDPLTVSQLREIGARHPQVPHTIVIVGARLEIPDDLQTAAARFDLSMPTLKELELLVHEEADAWGRSHSRRVQAKQAVIDQLVRNLAGLPRSDAQRLIRNAIHDDGVLDESDLPEVMDAKYRLLDEGGVLSFEMNGAKLSDVAGLENLKRWLGQRKDVFLSDAPPPGLDPPKGLLLLGVQGGGKSLAAKSVAGAWSVPLLRLDFAALYNKFYGETERNLRESLKTASIMAPCVLWIDEIEKGLATEGGDDGGPGKRILGTLLTWMSERKNKVFLVATANDIEALPPELLRKGRFDEIFFVDLPPPATRAKVFEIHLKKRGQDPAGFDVQALAAACEGFSGAEIEQAVVSALYAAHARKEPLSTEHVKTELASTKPLSVLRAENIAYLRAWAKERTVPAE